MKAGSADRVVESDRGEVFPFEPTPLSEVQMARAGTRPAVKQDEGMFARAGARFTTDAGLA